MQKLQHADVSPFTFDAGSVTTPQPYSICSAPSDDNDNMDASMLMSPDYVQPLIPSELVTLIQQIFDTDNIACLRHLAAKKLVQAQRSKVLTTQSIVLHPPPDPLSNHPLPNTTPTLSALNGPQAMILFANGLSPYAQAKIADHTQREEKLAQIRLAKWAADLQKSLQNEREKYEAIARGERAIWLKERIGECINDGSLLSVQGSALTATTEKVLASTKPDLPRVSGHRGLLDAGDPLGLLRWNETIRRRGWIAFQVLGGVGIGAMMAVWIARTLGIGNDGFTTWRWEWIGGRP